MCQLVSWLSVNLVEISLSCSVSISLQEQECSNLNILESKYIRNTTLTFVSTLLAKIYHKNTCQKLLPLCIMVWILHLREVIAPISINAYVSVPKRTFEILWHNQFPPEVIVIGSRPCTSHHDLNLKLICMKKMLTKM